MKQRRAAFAIMRFNGYLTRPMPEDVVTVVRVVWSQDRAQHEVDRLNQLQAEKEDGKNVKYFWQHTRAENNAEPGCG